MQSYAARENEWARSAVDVAWVFCIEPLGPYLKSPIMSVDTAFSLWFFNVVIKLERGVMGVLGISSTEKLG